MQDCEIKECRNTMDASTNREGEFMEPIVVSGSNSKKILELFKSQMDSFLPVKKLTVFFDNENFLLTPYTPANRSINMVIENTKGQQMHLDLNCGYGGQGPSRTCDLLVALGISEEKACRLIQNNRGVEFDFINDYAKPLPNFFASFEKIGEAFFPLEEYSQIEVTNRKIYMINPQINNLAGLLNAIQVMKPTELEYFTGDDSPLDNGRIVQEQPQYDFYEKAKGTKGINLAIYGELFDIFCYIDRECRLSFINFIYLYLMKRPLFENRLIKDGYISTPGKKLSNWSIIKSLFLNDIRILHDVVVIPKGVNDYD